MVLIGLEKRKYSLGLSIDFWGILKGSLMRVWFYGFNGDILLFILEVDLIYMSIIMKFIW